MQIIAAMAAASAMNAVTVFALYASSTTVMQIYSRPWMFWLLAPLLLYWFSRAMIAAHRREMSDDPIIYAFPDSASRITVAAIVCIMLAAISMAALNVDIDPPRRSAVSLSRAGSIRS